jgi:hypothetical protein
MPGMPIIQKGILTTLRRGRIVKSIMRGFFIYTKWKVINRNEIRPALFPLGRIRFLRLENTGAGLPSGEFEDFHQLKRKEGIPMKPPKSFLRSLSKNKRLKLRVGVYRQLKEREWLFRRIENGIVFLVHHSGVYGLGVKIEDIDWSEIQSKPLIVPNNA